MSAHRLRWMVPVLLGLCAGCGVEDLPNGGASPAGASVVVPSAGEGSSLACTVVAAPTLRLRRGPGTQFEQIDSLPQSTEVVATGRSADGGWLLVAVVDTGQRGWISGDADFVTCQGSIATLALVEVGSGSPTPTLPPEVATQLGHTVGATPPPASPSSSANPFEPQEPPPGVEEQLSYVLAPLTNLPCPDLGTPEPEPEIQLSFETIEILDPFRICLTGFEGLDEVPVTLLRPDGSVLQELTVPIVDGESVPYLTRIPALEPLGDYTAVASAGGTSYRTASAVVAATEPRMVIDRPQLRLGETVTADLAGYAPGTQVRLLLYRFDPAADQVRPYRFVSELPAVRADERGEARWELPTSVNDPAGNYIVVSIPFSKESRLNLDLDFELKP